MVEESVVGLDGKILQKGRTVGSVIPLTVRRPSRGGMRWKKMKMQLVMIGACICLVGCATPAQVRTIRKTTDEGRIPGMDKNTVFAFGFPNYHSGPYSSVDEFNVKIEEGVYKGKHATFVLGRSRETGEWEVVRTMVKEDGKWKSIPIKEKE